jgi:ADP-heptose:LPS heptosyltransferase
VAREAVRFFRELRRERFGAALDFQANLRGAIVARLSGAGFTVGFDRTDAREGSYRLHTLLAPPAAAGAHRVERNLGVPRCLGFSDADPAPRLPDFEAPRARARAFFGASDGRPVLLLHPGVSAFGEFKAWTEDGFAELARSAVERLGARVVFTWAPSDLALVQRIAARAACGARLAPACPTVADLAGFVAEASVVVAPDTGVLPVADALGTPLVGLFGPKDPAIYGPRYAPRRIVRSGVDCSPCPRRTCDHRTCMVSITPAMVFEAVASLLGDQHGRA